MPGRQFNGNDYRYGMNTQEKDNEIFEGAYSAEFWEYDSRLGRRWNTDPVPKIHESPYACFANNPIWFTDVNGADTNSVKGIEISMNVINEISKEIESVYNTIKSNQEIFDHNQKLIDDYETYDILGLHSSIFGAVLGLFSESLDIDKVYINQEKLAGLISEDCKLLGDLVNKRNSFTSNLKSFIDNSDGLRLDDGTILTRGVNKNNKNAKGNFVLYEIEIDGTHYKYGIGNADDVLKTNMTKIGTNGAINDFQKGTVRRPYTQARTILKSENSVSIKIHAQYNNVTKDFVLNQETMNIINEAVNRGYIGDGNSAHFKKSPVAPLNKFKNKYK